MGKYVRIPEQIAVVIVRDVTIREAELRMDRHELERLINEGQWRSTNYLSPHEYVLSRDYPELYSALKAYLLDHGYAGLFLDQEYTYVNLGAYRYWIVESVVNRASLETSGVEEVKD